MLSLEKGKKKAGSWAVCSFVGLIIQRLLLAKQKLASCTCQDVRT